MPILTTLISFPIERLADAIDAGRAQPDSNCPDRDSGLPSSRPEYPSREYVLNLARTRIVVAMDGERIVGFASFWTNARGALFFAELIFVWVSPDQRGQGIGRQLAEAVASHINTALRARCKKFRTVEFTLSCDFDSYRGALVFHRIRHFLEYRVPSNVRLTVDDDVIPFRCPSESP